MQSPSRRRRYPTHATTDPHVSDYRGTTSNNKHNTTRPPPSTARSTSTTPLDDDFDAPTFTATTRHASVYIKEPDPLGENAFEFTFGGAVSHVVRHSGVWMERNMETDAGSALGMGMSMGGSPHTVENPTLPTHSASLGGAFRSRRTNRDATRPERHERHERHEEPNGPGWESMGRRLRDGRKGRMRLVPKKVLEDNDARTVTLWREELIPVGATVTYSDESTLAGTIDEFGYHKIKVGESSKPVIAQLSKRTRSSQSTTSKAASKLESIPVPVSPHPDTLQIPHVQPVLSLDTSVSASLTSLLSPAATHTTQATHASHTSRTSPASHTSIHTLPTSPKLPKSPPKPSPKTLTSSPMLIAEIPPLAQRLLSPRHALRPRRFSNASMHALAYSTMDSLLSQCQPSLLHLRPILHELGITQRDHLRAVGRMGDAIRNAEIKPAAMKGGVTLIEWAMLMDLAVSRA